jgi:hypothetical protein
MLEHASEVQRARPFQPDFKLFAAKHDMASSMVNSTCMTSPFSLRQTLTDNT